ncbi:MAG TPA: phosphoribosylanthranilate isomerase [Ignavibacteriaceae bacterium]|nr:phosphoribosylanthranilate isomerase [Ignavibacteriaceae bacterium]
MRVKICGITNIKDALLAESLGANAIGFIFHKKSKRYVLPEIATEIIKTLSPFTIKVGVFVNEEPEAINKISSQIKLNVIQLHGDETPDIIEKIDLPVIKSFRINGVFDFTLLTKYKNVSFLFDSYSKEEYGGTGKIFNWDLIPTELNGNFILAGGITIDNIIEVFSKVKPKAIDVSSSLEKSPGKKDHLKVNEFFKRFNSIRSL